MFLKIGDENLHNVGDGEFLKVRDDERLNVGDRLLPNRRDKVRTNLRAGKGIIQVRTS